VGEGREEILFVSSEKEIKEFNLYGMNLIGEFNIIIGDC